MEINPWTTANLCERVNYFPFQCNAIGNKGCKSLFFRSLFFPSSVAGAQDLNLMPNHDFAVCFLLSWESEVVRNYYNCSKWLHWRRTSIFTVHSGFFFFFFWRGVTGLSAQPDAATTQAQGSMIQADAAGSSAITNIHTAMWAYTQPGTPPVEENYPWNRNSYLGNVRMVAETQSAFHCGTG